VFPCISLYEGILIVESLSVRWVVRPKCKPDKFLPGPSYKCSQVFSLTAVSHVTQIETRFWVSCPRSSNDRAQDVLTGLDSANVHEIFYKDIVLPSRNSEASEARSKVSWSKTYSMFPIGGDRGKRKEVVLTSSLT